MYPAAPHKFPTQTVDSSQVFERWILQKQPKLINNMTQLCDKNAISDLEQICPEQAQDFFSWLLSSNSILSRLILSSWSVICFVNSISHIECFRKKSCQVERINLVVNTNTINTYKNLQMLHSPFSIHLCFPLGTVKPCFVSERVTRTNPPTVRSDNVLTFWATTVISHPNFSHFVREVWLTVYTFRVL